MNDGEFTDEEEEGIDDGGQDDSKSLFTQLEGDYKTALAKLEGTEGFDEVIEIFTKLFDNFSQTYHGEAALINKNAEQAEQINVALDEIERLRRIMEADSSTIKELREQFKVSKRLTDDAHTREQQAQEIIENMRNQIVKLNTELELKTRIAGDTDEDMGDLSKTKEGFEREKQRMIDEITSLKQKLNNALSYSEELEHKNSAADLKTIELNNLLEQEITENSKKARQIETLEAEINNIRSEIGRLNETIVSLQEKEDGVKKQIHSLETQLKDARAVIEKSQKNVEIVQVKYEKAITEYEEIKNEYKDIEEKHAEVTRFYKLKIGECSQLRSDITKLVKVKDTLERKVLTLERFKFNMETEKEKLQTSIASLEKEYLLIKKKAETDNKQIDSLTKEKDVLHKNLMRVHGAVEQHIKLIKIQEQSKRKLEADMHNYNTEISNIKKQLTRSEKEKVKAVSETLDLTQQVEDVMDDIKMKQQIIYDNKKIIIELETKLRQQQNLFEAVRADRNSFQKQMQDATAEAAELRNKLKISLHQSEQLKEDISTKEKLLLKEETILRKVNKEKENLKLEVQAGLNQIQKLKDEIIAFRENQKTYTKQLQENDITIRKLYKQIDQIMNDRDIIGAQLVRRNDEIGLLYDKINILEVTLQRGEMNYAKRVEDIKLLKLEIKRLRQEREFLTKAIANMTDLKHEVFLLERELTEERLKCRALEEELQHPMNIHRWRKLEGSDPQVVDLLRKVQILQKRLLQQTSESMDREKQLKESEKLYLNLRQILARQPGPDIKNELIKTQRALSLRGTKMKCLISELNMYEHQTMEFKMDIDKITRELKETKRLFYKQRKIIEIKKTNKLKFPAIKSEDTSTLTSVCQSQITQQTNTQTTKYTGGGFKIHD